MPQDIELYFPEYIFAFFSMTWQADYLNKYCDVNALFANKKNKKRLLQKYVSKKKKLSWIPPPVSI